MGRFHVSSVTRAELTNVEPRSLRSHRATETRKVHGRSDPGQRLENRHVLTDRCGEYEREW